MTPLAPSGLHLLLVAGANVVDASKETSNNWIGQSARIIHPHGLLVLHH